MSQRTDGGILTFTAGEDLESHRRVKLDSTKRQVIYADDERGIGVTLIPAASGQAVSVAIFGAKDGTFLVEAAGAIALHARVTGAADGKVDDVATSSPAGPNGLIALNAAAADGDLVEVLEGDPGAYDLIADPGAAGAIPVTKSGRVPIVSAGAETRTLAAPTFPGQELQLELKTDGGDVTLTCATGLNQTGNNTAVTADAGDILLLKAIEVGANLRWRVAANDGWALSTV